MPEDKENLFSEFPPVSSEQWKEQIEKDIKGRSLDTLRWKPYEGFTVEPFYTQEDLQQLAYLTDSAPGQFPYTRGTEAGNNEWNINEYISEANIEAANKSALESLRMGAQSLTFVCRSEESGTSGVPIENKADMAALLKDIQIDEVPVHFKCGAAAMAILDLLSSEALNRSISLIDLRGSVDTNPIGELMLSGTYNPSKFDELKPVISCVSEQMPGFKGLTVHGEIFGDSGASAVQELSFSLASGVEYMDRLTSMGLTPEQIAGHMGFSFSIGSDYFMEIAKLRAARYLWAVLMEQYGCNEGKMSIETVSSGWNQTVYDPYTNMLRGTVAAMAATIGGSDTVHISPIDSAYEKPGEFTRRMARNTQLILKNESYIDRVIDPSAGSYYIENLTDSLIQAAWELFLEVEKAGGLIEALKSGLIQDRIEETRSSKDEDLETGRATLLGVNRYPDLSEQAPKTQLTGTVRDNTKFEIKPLKPYRGAEAFEKLRMATENHESGASVFLLPVGNAAMRTARAGFSANFFGCGGFTVIDKGAFDSMEEGIEAAIKSGSGIVVICSSDKEYPDITPAICEKLKAHDSDIHIIIAGNPKEHIEELKQAGVDDFIHVRSNILETLRKYQKAVRVE